MSPLDRVIGALVDALGPKVVLGAPLGALTTYRVGGTAAVLVTADSGDDLRAIGVAVGSVGEAGIATLVIGRGSNLLVADAGFSGVAVRLGDSMSSVEVDGHSIIAGGGAALPVVARRSVSAGLTGFEWAVGVPGTMGGAVRMNAGGHGSDMAASVAGVRVVDLRTGEDSQMSPSDLGFGYRSSAIGSAQVVASVRLSLAPGDRRSGEDQLAEIVRWRREHQPGGANAGSVFTNPPGTSAGRLIDQAGLKGLRIGTAEVSTKHANFIQADVDGSADDIARVMAEVRRRVQDHCGVALHAETHLVGFDPDAAVAAGASA